MIELYRHRNCAECADVEAALKEMVIAYEVIVVERKNPPETLPNDTPLPTLNDNGDMISGQAAVAARIKELQRFVHDWNVYQGDACYIDENGEVC